MVVLQEDMIKFFCVFYVLMIVSFCGLYLHTMYTQYKDAHDKWYDIIRENDIDREKKLK